jgi:hypothetical protein
MNTETIKEEMVTVFLTTEDVDKFVRFQKHYDLFTTLEEKKAFDINFGKVIFNIAFGEVQNIVKEEIVWKK